MADEHKEPDAVLAQMLEEATSTIELQNKLLGMLVSKGREQEAELGAQREVIRQVKELARGWVQNQDPGLFTRTAGHKVLALLDRAMDKEG